MDINGISQVMASYETTKTDKNTETGKKQPAQETKGYDAGKAAEYTKTESVDQVVKRDTALIEKMKAEAERNTEQLRSLVEKLLLKQGEKFTSLSDLFNKVKDGLIEVDPETVEQAKEDISEDGYWGVEQTSERLFSFAKALAGNDPKYADKMLDAMKKGFEQATKHWGDKLPDICQKTLDAATEKINNWKNDAVSEEASPETAEPSKDVTVS